MSDDPSSRQALRSVAASRSEVVMSGRGMVVAAVVCGVVAGACQGQPKTVRPEEGSYLPCSGSPRCPTGVGGACTMHDVLVARPSLINGARLAEGYLVLTDIEDLADTFIYGSTSGLLVASVSTPSESYRRQPDGRFAPTGECLGPTDLRVGPILHAWGKRARALAMDLAGADGGDATATTPAASSSGRR